MRKLSVKDTVLKAAEARNDKWGQMIIDRIQHVSDLVAVDAKYNACMKNLYNVPSSTGLKRRQRSVSNVNEAMESIYSYFSENSDKCQFSMNELINQIKGDYRPDIRTIKAHLLQKYGDDILLVKTAQKPPIVCFRNTGFKILTNAWYDEKKSDKREKRLRVVRTAAAIVLEHTIESL
ncbi:hypothetical protein RF55_3771 [Lasius niger]|uniref:Uncharacterized protein n=1 Tax=Lasius niger TaxID=67767 RepID=A0A0J7L018_LASNI|nr:hypothetical protein RF55_3771 [Lasius niger]